MAKLTKNLTQRKAELLVQSALLREKLAVETLSMMQMPDVVSKGLNLWNNLSRFVKLPILIVELGLFLLTVKPRRLLSWLLSATVLFKTWRRFGPFIMPLVRYLTRRHQ